MCVVAALCIYAAFFVQRAHSDVKAGNLDWAATSEKQRRFKMEPAWKTLKDDTLHKFLQSQASTLADKAVFLIGFAQSATARYITTDDGRGTAYLVFASIACGCAFIASMLLTVFLIFLADFETTAEKEAFSRRMMGFWKLTSGVRREVVVLSSLVLLLVPMT